MIPTLVSVVPVVGCGVVEHGREEAGDHPRLVGGQSGGRVGDAQRVRAQVLGTGCTSPPRCSAIPPYSCSTAADGLDPRPACSPPVAAVVNLPTAPRQTRGTWQTRAQA
jgi:hypothetical protein